jgi:response regulator RpfG family c-di-GMP phosphodiesterase
MLSISARVSSIGGTAPVLNALQSGKWLVIQDRIFLVNLHKNMVTISTSCLPHGNKAAKRVAQHYCSGGTMKVLIVESCPELGALWARHLVRQGTQLMHAATQQEATDIISELTVDIIVLDLVISEGSALAVSDYANFRQPEARVIFVTNTTFFSDGSIFSHAGNAAAFLPSSTPPSDLAAMVEHYGTH